jgi:hypothetical protein
MTRRIYEDFLRKRFFSQIYKGNFRAVEELTNCPPGTEAKFINKS